MRPGLWLAALAFAAPAWGEPVVSPDRLDDAALNAEAAMGEFAWRAFVALNWPAAGTVRGEPERAKALGEAGPRVWETFKSAAETFPFRADGRPTAWASYDGSNPCGGGNRDKTIAAFRPFAEFNQPSFDAGAPANALVAQNGEYVRYEIRFNRPQFETIATGGWSLNHPARFPAGAIAVKAAWRPLNDKDASLARSRYYGTRARIADVAGSLAAGSLICETREVALVGLHIVVRTPTRPQGIWATFEHVDNVPPAGEGAAREPDAREAGAVYGFFDPQRPAKLWPPFGSPETEPVDATHPPKLAPTPMQIVRRHPIDPELMAINHAYWSTPGVRGTAFAHYMLVAVQWPTRPAPPGPDNDGGYFPGASSPLAEESYKAVAAPQQNLVNSTMETYQQEAPSSCMACHHAVSNAQGFDFSGALATFSAR